MGVQQVLLAFGWSRVDLAKKVFCCLVTFSKSFKCGSRLFTCPVFLCLLAVSAGGSASPAGNVGVRKQSRGLKLSCCSSAPRTLGCQSFFSTFKPLSVLICCVMSKIFNCMWGDLEGAFLALSNWSLLFAIGN